MLISVVVPIYNVEKFLARCIESILNQSYKELEIILVNDGSPDGSLSICNEYANKDERVKVITQNNKGLSAARNTGFLNASGDYICFIDADDYIDKKMMEAYMSVVKKHYPEIILTNIFQYQKGNLIFTETKNNLPYDKLLNKDLITEYLIKPYYGGYLGIIPSACTKLYKLKFLRDGKFLFNQSLKRSEDYWFNFFVIKHAEKIYCINQSFYHYYANENSMIKSFREGQFDAFLNNRKELLKEHANFNFPINWKELDNQFVNNINELILLEINFKGIREAYKSISIYLSNKEFLKIYSNTSISKRHVKLIKFFLNKKMMFMSIVIFYIWSSKAK